jgi:ribosomal protein L29
MELHKLKMDEIRGWAPEKVKEAADESRLELAKIRMDIYTSRSANASKIRGLRKSLARLLTVQTQAKAGAAPKAAKAAKAPAAPKAAKAAQAKAKTADKSATAKKTTKKAKG